MPSGVLQTVKTSIRKIQHSADIQRLKKASVNLENIRRVHISLDDVQQIFMTANEQDRGSVLATPLLTELKRLHEQYEAKFSLYCFDDPAHRLNQFHCSELKDNEEWLRIGYHANKDGSVTLTGYRGFEDYYRGAGLSLASSLRLHYFDCPQELIPELRENGVIRLFCADDGRDSYGIPKDAYMGGYLREGIRFCPTDLRLEQSVSRLIEQAGLQGKEELIIFGHEIPFMKYREYVKLEAILHLLPDTVEYEL